MSKILIVDDEQDIVELLSYNLEKEGFSTVKAYDGEAALGLVRSEKPDLMILDLMLPKMNGLDVCKAIRRNPETVNLPIIMLTAKGDEIDKIIGLEVGADDYITKPFSIKELIARVRAVLRRMHDNDNKTGKEEFNYKELAINYASCLVQISGKPVTLSPTELKLLFFFRAIRAGSIREARFLITSGVMTLLLLIVRLMCTSGVCAARLRRIWKTRSIF
jgi:DNA-binding response OmpR family regulator